MPAGSWNEWSQHVLHELDRLDDCYKGAEHTITENYNTHKRDIAKLKLEMLENLKNLQLEQVKMKVKVAVIVAILTTIGNGLLFVIIKGIWEAIKASGVAPTP